MSDVFDHKHSRTIKELPFLIIYTVYLKVDDQSVELVDTLWYSFIWIPKLNGLGFRWATYYGETL
uniref:Uncharacterized protein n=1 Tax=Rhizophora mucronata TaxID=61149 RepID=A0A2P2IQR9_RHIMU